MRERSLVLRRAFVMTAAAVAAAIATSASCSALGATDPEPRVVLYLSGQPSTELPSARRLLATPPTASSSVQDDTDRQTGWLELRSTGSTPARATTAEPPAPSGMGYVWDADLGGKQVRAGAWSASIVLKGDGKSTVVPSVRIFRRSAQSGYTPIATSTGAAVQLGRTTVSIQLPSVTVAPVLFAPGDRLYIDLQAQVVTANCCRGNGILHLRGPGARLVIPPLTAAPASTASPAPTATPVPTATAAPAPTVTASPSSAPSTSPTPTATPVGGGVWRPRPGTSWQWQITGVVDTTVPAQMYDIDLFDAQAASSYVVPGFGTVNVPRGINAGVIDRLHDQGRTVVCYLDTGAWESYRPDQALFPKVVVGAQTYASTGAEWTGERWLDLRRASWPLFEPLIAARLDLAKRSGCDGVEPDQNNPVGNAPGFPITLADQKAWYLNIARLAHDRGLSVGQKNGIETTDAETVAAFDWNLNEECRLYSECSVLHPFIAAGKAVFHVEYVEDGMTTGAFCAKDNAEDFDGLLKRLDLGVWRQACR